MNAIATNATVTCPKCFGAGKLRHFGHVEGGTCFLCGGAKAVSQAEASAWLASQIRGDFAAVGPAEPKSAPRPFKSVDLGRFGVVRISRLDDGTFSARDVRTSDSDHDYTVFFTVTAGRVAVDGETVQHGMANHWRAFQAALQGALKA